MGICAVDTDSIVTVTAVKVGLRGQSAPQPMATAQALKAGLAPDPRPGSCLVPSEMLTWL